MCGPRLRVIVGVLLAVSACGLVGPRAAAAGAASRSILIYGPTLNGSPNDEQTLAEDLGYSVTVVDASQWAVMTQAQFSSYSAIVFGDPTCSGDPSILSTAVADRATWSAAATGPKVVIGTDPVFHQSEGTAEDQLIENGLEFATSGATTGLYADLSCYYADASPGTTIDLLGGFGTFTAQGDGADTAHILDPSHPVMSGLSDAGLSNWGSSIHETLDSYPPSFEALAENSADGLPYIIATRVGGTPGTPQAQFIVPSVMSSATTPTDPYSVKWAAGSCASGATYTLTSSMNGNPPTTVFTGTGRSTTVNLLPGNTFTLAVSCGGGPIATTFSLNGYQESAASYTKTWGTSSFAGAWGGSAMYSTVSGATATFTCYCAAFTWVTDEDSTHGSAKVYVDGVLRATVNTQSAAKKNRVVVFKYGWSTDGTHTMKIVNLATSGHPRISIDGFLTRVI